MGSADTTPWTVRISSPRSLPVDVSSDRIVETIWAITHFVYTGDNEVNFVRYSAKPSKPVLYGVDAVQSSYTLSSVIKNYRVDEDAKPAEISSTQDKDANDSTQTIKDPGHDVSSPSFIQLIRQIGLLVVHEDDGGLELMDEISNRSSVSPFHFSQLDNSWDKIRNINDPDKRDNRALLYFVFQLREV
jgi:hypothetical protein